MPSQVWRVRLLSTGPVSQTRTNVQAERRTCGDPQPHRQGSADERRSAMASIQKERTIEASPDEVWAALRDWGALHERLVPGFVVDTQLDGEDRIVTFFNGAVARER